MNDHYFNTSSGLGGAIFSTENLGIVQSDFVSCSATVGGALNALSVDVSSSVFDTCNTVYPSVTTTQQLEGGAIVALNVLVTNSNFLNCHCLANCVGGGAISSQLSNITRSFFTNCTTTTRGGAVLGILLQFTQVVFTVWGHLFLPYSDWFNNCKFF